MSDKKILLRLVVGRYFGEKDAYPVVVGAMDETVWEVIPDEDYEKWARERKEEFSPDWLSYDWAEAVVSLDRDALNNIFDVRELKGEVRPA